MSREPRPGTSYGVTPYRRRYLEHKTTLAELRIKRHAKDQRQMLNRSRALGRMMDVERQRIGRYREELGL